MTTPPPPRASLATLEQPSESKKAAAGISTIEEGSQEVLPYRERHQQPMTHTRLSLSTVEHQSNFKKEGASAIPIANGGSLTSRAIPELELTTRVSLVALEQQTDSEKAGRTYAAHHHVLGSQQERCTALPCGQQASKTRVLLMELERPSESKTTLTGTTAVKKCRTPSDVISNQQPKNAQALSNSMHTLRTELVLIQEETHVRVMIPDQDDANDPRSSQAWSSSRRSPRSPAVRLSRNKLDSASVVSASMLTFFTLPSTTFHTLRWKFGMIATGLVGVGTIGCIVALLVTMKHKNVTVPTEGTATPPAEASYLQQLQDQLIGSEQQYLRPGSPQLEATLWLAMVDEPRMNLTATNLKQRYALMVLWYAHGGKDWMDQNVWAVSGVHECKWEFVSCNSNNEVSEIVKGDGMLLTGSLASEIGLLSSLEVLNLARCRLRGGFPMEIYSLTNLRVLDVSGNKMSSTISDDVANLMQLQDFHVHLNFFSGSIPSNFPTSIRSFRISSNDFTGNPWAMLATWPNVQYFDVSNTPTYGSIPTGIGLLTNLAGIESQMTNLEGTIPSEIGYLTNLAAFDSPNCGLTGTIPSELGLCTKLTSLTLSTNSFDSASIPTVLGTMTQLKILTLNGLSFTGTIPTELIRLVNLEELLLNDNFLTGTIPVGWNGTIQGQGMDRIWLDFNLLTGPLPAHFCPRELHVDCEVGCGSCMACACV